MYKFPIGVMLESFHKPAAEAMDACPTGAIEEG